MIDHIILTVSDVDRSLAFYEAALAPLNIKFFPPYKGEKGHPDLWGFGDGKRAFFWLQQGKPDPQAIHWDAKRIAIPRSTSSTSRRSLSVRGTTSHHARGWNTIRAITPPMS